MQQSHLGEESQKTRFISALVKELAQFQVQPPKHLMTSLSRAMPDSIDTYFTDAVAFGTSIRGLGLAVNKQSMIVVNIGEENFEVDTFPVSTIQKVSVELNNLADPRTLRSVHGDVSLRIVMLTEPDLTYSATASRSSRLAGVGRALSTAIAGGKS